MTKKSVKDNLITILFIIGISFFIVSQFLPVSSYVHSDFLVNTFGEGDYNFEWKQVYFSLFLYVYMCDNSYIEIGEKPVVSEQIFLFYLFPITLSYDERPNLFNMESYQNNPNVGLEALLVAQLFSVIAFAMMLFVLYYFIKFLRDINTKHAKTPLFLGVLYLASIIMIYLGSFFVTDATEIGEKFGRANYVRLGYGFYYQLVVVIILFLIYFIQNKPKFLENVNKK